jgi:type IV secretory pathway VirB2 component (pilin)
MSGWFGINNPVGGDFTTVQGTANKFVEVINGAINVAGLVAVIIILYGAYLMIISSGDADKFDQGNKAITGAIIGLIIVFVSKMVVLFLSGELGF